jgi:hypothetical protein
MGIPIVNTLLPVLRAEVDEAIAWQQRSRINEQKVRRPVRAAAPTGRSWTGTGIALGGYRV